MASTTTRTPRARSRPSRPSASTSSWIARAAATRFRKIDDQADVDRIVRALVVAGLEHAVELARLAMEDTGFGVFEDKVVKNYIATEFLHDYLKDKRSVGVIEEDAARASPTSRADRRRARADPDHEPDLDGAVQGDRRRQDAQRDDLPPVGARCALRATRRRTAAGGRRGRRHAAGDAAGDPRPTLDVSQYLFHHPGVDFIWTTGGPKASPPRTRRRSHA